MNILIVGCGVVGNNLANEIKKLEPETYDKYKNIDTRTKDHYDVAFVCVDTPISDDNLCDTTEVVNAIENHNADIYVIKSTVLPHTTEKLVKETGKQIIFSPEYYGATQFANAGGDFVILGGDDESYMKIRTLYELVKGADFTVYHCKNTEAEIIKYMENSFLALKVIFCNQFKDITDLYNVSYSAVRDGFVLDKRVGKSHTFVYDDYRGYDSKCLNKDIPALISAVKEHGFKSELLMEAVDRINNTYRAKK